MNFDTLTPDAIRSLDLAVDAARERHNIFVDVEHLLIGALQTQTVERAMTSLSLNASSFIKAVLRELSIKRDKPLGIKEMKGLTDDARQTLQRAGEIARTLGSNHVSSGSIALSILSTPTPFLREIFKQQPAIDISRLSDALQSISTPPTRTFQQKWNPNTWENGRVLALEPHGRAKVIQFQPQPNNPARQPRQSSNENNTDFISNNAPIFIGLALLAAVLYGAVIAPSITISVVIVVGGWIFSLVMHEFAHALVAYWGGDDGVVERGYLSLNPLKYTHPLLSIGLPLFFLAIGGIGLPGGAVFINRSRLRSRYWGSLVSAAGPFASFLCMILFAAPFWTGYVTLEQNYFDNRLQWGSLAFLVFLQATAILINLIPLPPLDGFGIIEPFLPDDLAMQMRSFGSIGLLLIIMMFWLPDDGSFVNPGRELFRTAEDITYTVGVAPGMPGDGYDAFRFWDDN